MFLPAQQLQSVLQITVHSSTLLQMGCKWKVNKVDDFTATRGVPHGLIVSVEDVEARTRTRIQFQFFLLIKCSCFTWFVRCHLCVMQRYETENVRLYTLVPNRIGKSVHLPESIHFLITISFVQIIKSDSFRCTRLSLFWIGRVFALYAAARLANEMNISSGVWVCRLMQNQVEMEKGARGWNWLVAPEIKRSWREIHKFRFLFFLPSYESDGSNVLEHMPVACYKLVALNLKSWNDRSQCQCHNKLYGFKKRMHSRKYQVPRGQYTATRATFKMCLFDTQTIGAFRTIVNRFTFIRSSNTT